METPLLAGAACSACGEPLNAGGSCLICLLRGAMPDPAAQGPPSPSEYGDFEIARREDGALWELGRGAMGVTYKAVDRVLHRTVALKVIQFRVGGAADDVTRDALRERFLREARAAAALRHANVAGVFQFGASDDSDRCYCAMELVEGETLDARVRREGPLKVGEALELARQVAAALVAAAGRGLIHRDLKPGNLMLSRGDDPAAGLEVKVIDFGLAKAITEQRDLTDGGFVGTLAFASPEQFARQAVDARSDLYSLGITLWYALTGTVPFVGHTRDELRDHPAREHLPVEQLTARGVPGAVIVLLRRLLSVIPDGRPASARELVGALDACRAQLAVGRSRVAWRRRWAVAALVLAAAGGVWWWARVPASGGRRAPALVSDKSLAVLPFDNFSADKDSAFFADGVQDEVLTDLAKVAGLKVISRASVARYKDSRQRSLREIAENLGAAYVVEGSVQRVGNKIRVTAQLIDARTDTHLWAEHYDREVQDVFAIESEIAQAITDQLSRNVSPAERSLLATPPTASLPAYELYTQARAIYLWDDPAGTAESIRKKMALLEETVRRDPGFALAYCELSRTYADYAGMANDPPRLELARQAAEKALELHPGLGEAHRELARFYLASGDLARGHDEAALAVCTLPNDAEAHRIVGEADLSRDQWAQALPEMEKAHELDPSDHEVEYRLAEVRLALRRYPEMERDLLKNRPVSRLDANWLYLLLAESRLATGDPAAARDFMARVPPDFSPVGEFPSTRFDVALYLRDYDAAEREIAATSSQWVDDLHNGNPPQTLDNGLLAHLRGDEARARTILTSVRQGTTARDEREGNGVSLGVLSRCDAALGRKEDAIREALQAVGDHPLSRQPQVAKSYLENLAQVYALTGERAQAIGELETLSKMDASISYGSLRCDPRWDALRGDPRFEAVAASLAPKP